MKILAFVDLHGNSSVLKKIIKKSKNADLLICAGDISEFGFNLKKLLSTFDKLNKPMLILPGNHEDEEELENLCTLFKNIIYIHRKTYLFKDYLFFGDGSGGFSQTNKDLEQFAKTINSKEKLIFITHSPPYNTKLDFIPYLGHRGCKSVRKVIENLKPILHICGHFHESEYMIDKIKSTKTINPGPEGMIVDLPS